MKIKCLNRKGKHWEVPIAGDQVSSVSIGSEGFRLKFESDKWIDIDSELLLKSKANEYHISKPSVEESKALICLLYQTCRRSHCV